MGKRSIKTLYELMAVQAAAAVACRLLVLVFEPGSLASWLFTAVALLSTWAFGAMLLLASVLTEPTRKAVVTFLVGSLFVCMLLLSW